MSDVRRLKPGLHERARDLGFDICRVTAADLPKTMGSDLQAFLTSQYHGTMRWLKDTADRRQTPKAMWPQARTAIVLGLNYGPDEDPLINLQSKDRATISVYARNRDYHDIIKGRLKTLAGWLASKTSADVKVFVDTAPLMEKPLAARAGLGWQGKHTNLVSRDMGSWLFLGVILTTADIEPDSPEEDHCGSCRACLDICPTNAFPAPYRINASRCISYLTIEHKGPIPVEFREAMGNRIYGCDDCLAVCPWNKFAQTANEVKLKARDDLRAPKLAELAGLDDQKFRTYFSGSPIKRIGLNRFLRNVLIAIGNSGTSSLLDVVYSHLRATDPVVRGAAVWALSRLENPTIFADMKHQHGLLETDETVRHEWERNG